MRISDWSADVCSSDLHAVRTLHSCARALDVLGSRGTVRLHGACVGSGVEVAAAAHRRIAVADSWFQLPAVRMGLIPGDGGTATGERAMWRARPLWRLLTSKTRVRGQECVRAFRHRETPKHKK